jgi:hypothetical protein
LNGARKAVCGIDGDGDWLTDTALRDGNGSGREDEGKIGRGYGSGDLSGSGGTTLTAGKEDERNDQIEQLEHPLGLAVKLGVGRVHRAEWSCGVRWRVLHWDGWW